MKQEGKFNFTGFLMIVIIVYGAYALIKIISTSLMESQIENEIVDTFGLMRGADFDDEKAAKVIRDILMKNDVIFDEHDSGAVDVQIKKQEGKIYYYYRYEVETDFLFFKKKKVVEVDHDMQSYG